MLASVALATALLVIGLSSQFSKTQAESLPLYTISYKQTPTIASHVSQAIQSGRPWKLTYIGSKNPLNDQNRKKACKGLPSPRPAGKQCDEYPFASTYQGGTGASAVLVPEQENSIQGGQLSSFYQSKNLKDGDQFLVGVSF